MKLAEKETSAEESLNSQFAEQRLKLAEMGKAVEEKQLKIDGLLAQVEELELKLSER